MATPLSPRATKAEVRERKTAISEKLELGWHPHRVARFFAKEWGIGQRAVWRYLEKIYADWAEAAKRDAPQKRERLERQAQRAFSLAIEAGNFQGAAKLFELLCRVAGVEAATQAIKVEASTTQHGADAAAVIRDLVDKGVLK